MRKFKRTIIAVTASGLILFSAAGKSEAIPAPLQNIWDATIGRIASSFTNISNQYLV